MPIRINLWFFTLHLKSVVASVASVAGVAASRSCQPEGGQDGGEGGENGVDDYRPFVLVLLCHGVEWLLVMGY
jgi:hypothetical protein